MTIMASSIYGIQSNTSPNEYPQQKLSKKGTNALIDHSINWIQRWSPTQVRTFMLCIVNFTWPWKRALYYRIVLQCFAMYCIVLHLATCSALHCSLKMHLAGWSASNHCNVLHYGILQNALKYIIAIYRSLGAPPGPDF